MPGSTVAMPDEDIGKWANHYTEMKKKGKKTQIEFVKCNADFFIYRFCSCLDYQCCFS